MTAVARRSDEQADGLYDNKLQACIRTMAKSPGFPANAPVAPATAAQMTCNIVRCKEPSVWRNSRLLIRSCLLGSAERSRALAAEALSRTG